MPELRLYWFWLKKHLKEAVLPKDITCVALRNTYISNLMAASIDFIQVSHLFGCRDLNELWKNTGRFIRADRKTEDLQ